MSLNKKNTITILLFIIILGSVLRFYRLGATSFVADEFLDINSSYAYAKTGTWQNWDFNFGRINEENAFEARDSRAWIYKWQVAQILRFGKLNEASARTISLIWGLISIVSIFFVARYFTKSKEIGLISAFLFAISIMGIAFDRKLRMYSMFFPLFLLFSWFFYRFLEEDYKGKISICKLIYKKLDINIAYLIPMLFFGILSILTHQLTVNIVIAFVVYAAINLYPVFKNKKPAVNKYSLGLIAIIIGFFAATLFFPGNMKSYTKELEFFGTHLGYFSKIFSDYNNILLAIIILISGVYYLYKTKTLKKEALWLSVSFFAILFSAIFIWNRNTGEQYIFFITSFEMILIASGIYGISEFMFKNIPRYKKASFFAPLAVLLLILPNFGYFFQDSNTYKQTAESGNANYKKVFGYFMKAKKEGDVLITRNFRNFYWKGAKTKVYDFGGELTDEKLSLEDIKKIQSENASGWFIISDNDDIYISGSAIDYIQKNFEHISNSEVRGKVMVYRWGT